MASNKAERNGMWKGDKINIKSPLHQWVRYNLPQPKLCEICNKKPSYDLANITGVYDRDFKNWKYLCRSCHMISDGRLKKLHQCRTSEERSIIAKEMWSKLSRRERYNRIWSARRRRSLRLKMLDYLRLRMLD